ncbi:MAG: cyclic nucleotide-binding domain-containing protein [Myxococcota bacterium]
MAGDEGSEDSKRDLTPVAVTALRATTPAQMVQSSPEIMASRFVAGLSPEGVEALTTGASAQRMVAGVTVVTPGAVPPRMGIIMKGTVRVQLPTSVAPPPLQKGDVVGLERVVDQPASVAQVAAGEVVILWLSDAAIMERILSTPSLHHALREEGAMRVRWAELRGTRTREPTPVSLVVDRYGVFARMYCRELSPDGMFIPCTSAPPEGDPVHITFFNDAGEILCQMPAVVELHRNLGSAPDEAALAAGAEPCGVFVQFTDHSAEARAGIHAVIDSALRSTRR